MLLGWKTYKYYYTESDELPNPRPTQPKNNQVKSGILATLSPQQIVFRGVGLIYVGNIIQETQPNQILRKHPIVRLRRSNIR